MNQEALSMKDNDSNSKAQSSFQAKFLGQSELFIVALFATALVATITYILISETFLPPPHSILRVKEWILPLLSSALGLGIIVMAIIQVFKPVIRARFHRQEVQKWLRTSSGPDSLDKFLGQVSPGQSDTILELPIEQIVAQIQTAFEATLASDKSLDWFVESLIGKSDPPDSKLNDEDPKAQIQKRTRQSYIVQRRLDALLIQVKCGWRRRLRLLLFAVSFILAFLIAAVFDLWRWDNFIGIFALVLLLSALSSFFASVARDAVAIIERLRN
jgi:hypothetical protein